MNKLKALWEDSSSRRVVIFFIGIIVLLIVSLFFQQERMEQQMELKVQFIEQKNMLRDELDDLIDEHDGLLSEYGELNNQLHEKDSIIQKQISEIRSLIRTKNDLSEARKKIEALKEIAKKYIANIDSLLVVNDRLITEKDSVINVNKNINWKNYKLNKQNAKLAEKVSKGSVLEILSIDVESVRFRSTGREMPTKYAKKVQKLRVCFEVGANQISDAEQKEIYFQLVDEKGEVVLGGEDVNTTVGDSLVSVTSSSLFDYKNIEMSHCFEWERVQALLPGTYTINLIVEGNFSTTTELKLR